MPLVLAKSKENASNDNTFSRSCLNAIVKDTVNIIISSNVLQQVYQMFMQVVFQKTRPCRIHSVTRTGRTDWPWVNPLARAISGSLVCEGREHGNHGAHRMLRIYPNPLIMNTLCL